MTYRDAHILPAPARCKAASNLPVVGPRRTAALEAAIVAAAVALSAPAARAQGEAVRTSGSAAVGESPRPGLPALAEDIYASAGANAAQSEVTAVPSVPTPAQPGTSVDGALAAGGLDASATRRLLPQVVDGEEAETTVAQPGTRALTLAGLLGILAAVLVALVGAWRVRMRDRRREAERTRMPREGAGTLLRERAGRPLRGANVDMSV
ncbi:hypothetical protein I5E68_01645 [Novosphingobium sp. YJ-S2-02]|uniref:Uncharacterized protein n=1 Tax=Novosphingobium aureum TaxID=2792964 RepID=A0A931MJF2_9SPHN|nr:hypothetical protein [Novosphingobium aureum]MBH0111653.1 hypothetical protein [Novosphingobium aureum]